MYKSVQELTEDINKSDSAGIKSKNDKLLTEQTEVLSRWSEYTGELTTIEVKTRDNRINEWTTHLKSEVEFILSKIEARK